MAVWHSANLSFNVHNLPNDPDGVQIILQHIIPANASDQFIARILITCGIFGRLEMNFIFRAKIGIPTRFITLSLHTTNVVIFLNMIHNNLYRRRQQFPEANCSNHITSQCLPRYEFFFDKTCRPTLYNWGFSNHIADYQQ